MSNSSNTTSSPSSQQQQQQVSFAREQHMRYIAHLDDVERDSFEYQVTEHLRMSGIYWALTALDLFILDGDQQQQQQQQAAMMDREKVVQFVLQCHDERSGGFSGNTAHDPHLLYTLSAVQVLAVCRALDRIDRHQVAKYVLSLQRDDGSFAGDEWGEVDTRFSYCALSTLRLLGFDLRQTMGEGPLERAIDFVLRCRNFDGGFGAVPGAESHAGQIFCCVGALAIADALHRIETRDLDTLAWWLCERQVQENGGLNGRPEKKSDVCYSWWVLSCLAIMDKLHWINTDMLHGFILECQDTHKGGISDKPNNMVDVYHTFFGIAGLSLLKAEPNLKSIDPMFALPVDALRYCGIETVYTRRFKI